MNVNYKIQKKLKLFKVRRPVHPDCHLAPHGPALRTWRAHPPNTEGFFF